MHISQLAPERVAKVEDVLNVGDTTQVKVMEIDGQGRVNLSRKAGLLRVRRTAAAVVARVVATANSVRSVRAVTTQSPPAQLPDPALLPMDPARRQRGDAVDRRHIATTNSSRTEKKGLAAMRALYAIIRERREGRSYASHSDISRFPLHCSCMCAPQLGLHGTNDRNQRDSGANTIRFNSSTRQSSVSTG